MCIHSLIRLWGCTPVVHEPHTLRRVTVMTACYTCSAYTILPSPINGYTLKHLPVSDGPSKATRVACGRRNCYICTHTTLTLLAHPTLLILLTFTSHALWSYSCLHFSHFLLNKLHDTMITWFKSLKWCLPICHGPKSQVAKVDANKKQSVDSHNLLSNAGNKQSNKVWMLRYHIAVSHSQNALRLRCTMLQQQNNVYL